jgi:ATP-binding cassette subfamily B (MDR/TAP) protein 1
VSEQQMRDACKKANCADFIEILPHKYDTIVGEFGNQLSGGQKQRIAIARALIGSPSLLILDEATSALDAESEALVQDALNRACVGITTLIVSHRLSTIKNVNKIFVINDGQVVEIGKHDELMTKQGVYYNLVNSQVFTDNVEEETEEFAHQRRSPRKSISSLTSRRKSSYRHSIIEDNIKRQKDAISEKERLIKELEEEGGKQQNLLQILRYSKPEWTLIFGGIIVCVVGGTVFPTFSILFSNIYEVFAEPDPEEKRQQGHKWSIMFLIIGLIAGISMLFQSIFFGTTAERLTKRLRCRLFEKILSMEIGFFDAPNHTTGKLCTRLSMDCPNVKSVSHTRIKQADHILGY